MPRIQGKDESGIWCTQFRYKMRRRSGNLRRQQENPLDVGVVRKLLVARSYGLKNDCYYNRGKLRGLYIFLQSFALFLSLSALQDRMEFC